MITPMQMASSFLFQVVRYEPKTFRQRRRVVKMDGTSAGISWEYNIKGISRVLYRLPKVLAAEQVLVVEGETDVESLEHLGFVATCNPGGACNHAGRWLKNYTESLAGKRVVILPDNDTPGQKHAEIVSHSDSASCQGTADRSNPGRQGCVRLDCGRRHARRHRQSHLPGIGCRRPGRIQ